MDLMSMEKELINLINLDKKNWTSFYLLLKQIENQRLWENDFRSFTAWVKDFCMKTKTHESIVWARKKAGEVYQSYAEIQKRKGVEVKPISEIDVAQDTLVLLDKISKKAPELGAELTEKALNKEIKKKDLREAYTSIRNRAEGRTYDNMKEITVDAGSVEDTNEDLAQEAITATELITTLYNTEWLNVKAKRKYFKSSFEQDKYRLITEFPVFTGSSRKSRRIDALISENLSSNNSWELVLHGVEIKVSKSDLVGDMKYTEYADFVDYLWLAVPEDLVDIAKETKPAACGIISIHNKEAKIIKMATKLDSPKKIDTLTNLALKLL